MGHEVGCRGGGREEEEEWSGLMVGRVDPDRVVERSLSPHYVHHHTEAAVGYGNVFDEAVLKEV